MIRFLQVTEGHTGMFFEGRLKCVDNARCGLYAVAQRAHMG